ncbi:ectopic P granules protein 5 homolog [Macrosteles quadrilineatus]|uniref:ectopic P granules protein 5 homolog n=1 Tax=Macrosteles quadrilineatus TaxID=74068 RepID=UPI0023E0F2E7|nr:ectopic P granules protein 5 homolog [Macrosteles quadrilineatus]
MEAIHKARVSQNKKKTKKSKFKTSDGKVQECSYETLPQEVESLTLSDSEELPQAEVVNSAETVIPFVSDASEVYQESVNLLEYEGIDHLEVQPNELKSWQESNLAESSEISNYFQDSKDRHQGTLTETELDEIHSPIAEINLSSHANTTFESPYLSSPSVESAQGTMGLWVEPGKETEIANEASPSAPVLQIPCSNSIESNVDEITPDTGSVVKDQPFFPFHYREEECEQTVKPFTLQQLNALYHNQELEGVDQFVAQFVESEARSGDSVGHPLYQLLTNFLRARAKLAVNNVELDALKQECADHQSHLWSLEKCVVTERGECQDGNPVEASHEFQTAHYNKSLAMTLTRSLCSVRDLVAESFALNAYTCEVVKLQVENYIQKLEAEFSFLPHNAPVNLISEALPTFSQTGQDFRAVIRELRAAISVLFTFQRRPLRDEVFVSDSRGWLARLVGVLLRVATWQDHLFLIHHVLRCPAGVGKWAAWFIQPPDLPFNSPSSSQHLDHLVTCLASVLLPVQARDLFLNQMVVSVGGEVEGDSAWFLVDSDGEDEADTVSLRESDIVAFLNQVPFDAIFRQVLQISLKDEKNVYNSQLVTDHHMLRLIAFCHLVLSLLESGLNNHATLRYRQYSKRLGRLVRHTAQYVTDQWQLFRSEGQSQDPGLMARLYVEYDALMSRAVATLYHSPRRSAWQFLAVLPFGSISTQRLWKLFRFLILADDEPVVDEIQWNIRLEEQLGRLSDAEIYYLLTAINTMALSRTEDDWPFIQATTLQLLEIGFLNVTTRDTCHKSARIMLANLTSKYPALMTDIIARLNGSSNCGKLSLYLMKELPIAQWRPNDTDLDTIECWLINNSIQSVKHALARYIVSTLNLGFATDDLSHELFLPRGVHVRLAVMVLKTAVQWCPQSPSEGNAISDTVKQMATLAALMARPSSSEQAVTVWVWQMAYKLRLHLLDQSDASVRHTLANPSPGLSQVPEEMALVEKYLKNHQAMAVYMSLQITAIGHNVPLICSRGFALLSVLQSCQLYTAVISLLQHLVPLFLDCPNTLIKSDMFLSTILTLLSADRTFFKTAKSLITTDFPGHILQQFGDMIHYHLYNYSKYNLMSSTPLAQLWLQILCIMWSEEPTSASYLMDVVLSCAFFRPDISAMAYDNLGQLLQTLISTSQANSRLSSLFSWMSSSAVASLVPQGSSCPQAPWFAYFALHVEEIHNQGSNGLWREVVKELCFASGKPNVDNAVKRACATLKLSVIPASALSVYRWSMQALDTPVDHPVLPLLWQRFFILYFTRLISPNGVDHGSVGYKMFEGLTYQTYHKRLKRKLSDCVEYFRTKAGVPEISQEKHLLYDTLSKLYETFSLWLDEPRLHESGLYIPALPLQYNPYKLSVITSAAEQNPWYEYVDYDTVKASQNASIEQWQRTQGRDITSQAKPPLLNISSQASIAEHIKSVNSFNLFDQNPWYEYVDYETVKASQNASIERWQRTQGRDIISQAKPPLLNISRQRHNLSGQASIAEHIKSVNSFNLFDQNPWYEYVDYETVKASQNASIERWQRTQGRDITSQAKPPQITEDGDPIQRINKRLQTYDSPLPPPPLKFRQAVVPSIHREALLHKGVMLDSLKPSFKAILEYAQNYSLRLSEHTALDCSLMELLPSLYTHIETEIALHAACDTTDPRVKPPSAHALNCAGPAVIYIKISPACINEAVRQQVDNNRSEVGGLLKRCMQSPPTTVCAASVHIENAAQTLEKEFTELKKIGDVQLLNPLKDVGVVLFYHLCDMFTDDAMSYPPLKQLVTSCIEKLGNMFISGEEKECVRLLTTVLQNPPLAGLLGPHFTPAAASPNLFLQMYCTLVDSDQTSPDLLFVLLSKFDINQWLTSRKPKLIERSQVIELAGKALATAGLTPSQELLTLHGIFRNHLATMFMYDFPEHYGEVLSLVLRHSETQSLAPDVWYDLVNAMVGGSRLHPGLSLAQLKEVINQYATEQRALSVQELRDTSSLLGNHFTKERLQYGLYGLYPKYRIYVEPLMVFQGMIGHALVVATLQNDRGTLSDKLCEQLWPYLAGLFCPWLAPYFTRNLTEPTAAWIQQLTDDRSVLPPWIVADGGHAHKLAAMFVECIRFMMDTLPAASSNILSCVWQFYVTNYAHNSIKDHILSVTHGNLISLPWQRFFPSLQDIDLMLKVVDQYLPDCHTFVGAIFIQVSWQQWIQQVCSSQVPQTATRVHSALLHLLIKLANEPNVRQSGKVTPLLVESQQFSWHLIECSNYEAVVNWLVMSYDPRVILQIPGEDWSNTDMAALDLLETAAGYSSKATQFHSSTPRKRQMFVRSCVKLLLSALSRYKQLTVSHQDEIRATVRRMVDKVETIVTATVPGPQRVSEAGLLMTEILTLVNQGNNSVVASLTLEALLGWLDTRSAASVVVAALMRVLGITVANPDTLGALLEASLTAFFRKTGMSDSSQPSWSMVVHTLQPIVPRHPPLEDSLVANSHLLSLYALSIKHLPTSLDVREEANLLNNLNQWLALAKISDSVESKVPLLWSHALYLAWRQCEYSSDAEAGPLTLRRITTLVAQAADHRAGAWGLLGAIGIVKSTAPSNKCKLLGRFLVALVLAQLPECHNNNGQDLPPFVRTKPHAPGAISSNTKDYTPSAEAVKALAILESCAGDKAFTDLRTTVEFAVKVVKQAENSLHNTHQLVMDVARQLYSDPFLHAHRLTDKPQA